jgi:Thioredoxin
VPKSRLTGLRALVVLIGTILPVDGLGYSIGDEGAPVHVVEFADLGWKECRAVALETMPTPMEEFVDTGRVRS